MLWLFKTAMALACENSRFSSLFAAWDVSRGETSATQRQKFHTVDVNQCLHNKSGSHGVPNADLFNLRFSWSILVKCFVHLRTSSRKTEMLLLEKNIIHKYWLFCYRFIAYKNLTFVAFCLLMSFVNNSSNNVTTLSSNQRLWWNFCRWVADVPPRETFPAAKSEEKRLFSQATIAHAFKVFVWRNDGLLPSKGWSV